MNPIVIIIGILVVSFGFTAFFGAPYVPSRRRLVKKAFKELYAVSADDVVVDIGSGDGKVLRIAAAMGARGIGFELHPVLVLASKLLSRRQPKVTVLWRDIWHSRLPTDTTLVYIFSVSRDSKRMTDKLTLEATRLKRPLVVMTYGSELYELKPIKTLDAYFLYTVPPLHG